MSETHMDTPGLGTGLRDRNGDPVQIGDVLEFDAQEWGGGTAPRLEVRFRDGELTLNGVVSDVGEWCTIVRKWDAAP